MRLSSGFFSPNLYSVKLTAFGLKRSEILNIIKFNYRLCEKKRLNKYKNRNYFSNFDR
jgi:hypothetical protein